jgi:CrcB protein
MERFFWICLAGALGTGVRHGVNLWIGERDGFPLATFVVNVVGCFLIAAALEASVHFGDVSPTVRLAITTGFLGGLTTYSTFNEQTLRLVRDGAHATALANVTTTLVAGIVAGLAGLALARKLFAP